MTILGIVILEAVLFGTPVEACGEVTGGLTPGEAILRAVLDLSRFGECGLRRWIAPGSAGDSSARPRLALETNREPFRMVIVPRGARACVLAVSQQSEQRWWTCTQRVSGPWFLTNDPNCPARCEASSKDALRSAEIAKKEAEKRAFWRPHMSIELERLPSKELGSCGTDRQEKGWCAFVHEPLTLWGGLNIVVSDDGEVIDVTRDK